MFNAFSKLPTLPFRLKIVATCLVISAGGTALYYGVNQSSIATTQQPAPIVSIPKTEAKKTVNNTGTNSRNESKTKPVTSNPATAASPNAPVVNNVQSSPAVGSATDQKPSSQTPVSVPPPASSTGYPNSSNTGYAAAGYSQLTPHAGDWVITTPGTYSGYDVSGTLTIMADNVIFQGCNVHGATGGDLITIRGANVQILDCNIHGNDNTTAGSPQNSWIQVYNQNFTLKRSNLYNSSGDGIRDAGAPGLYIENNYIHDWVQNPTNGPHSDGITDGVDGNTGPWTIRHNTILMWSNAGLTNVISLAAGNFLLHDIVVNDNLLGGGGYTVHGGGDTNYTNITFSNNKFTTMFSPVCGEYGILVTPPVWGTRGTSWTNNTWYDGSQVGQVIPNP